MKEKNKPKKYQAAKILIFLYSIKMSRKTLKFDNIEVKKNFIHLNKQFFRIQQTQVVISGKFKGRNLLETRPLDFEKSDSLNPKNVL